MVICCKCGRSGVCRNYFCVKNGKHCTNCMPSCLGKCTNYIMLNRPESVLLKWLVTMFQFRRVFRGQPPLFLRGSQRSTLGLFVGMSEQGLRASIDTFNGCDTDQLIPRMVLDWIFLLKISGVMQDEHFLT